MSLLLRVLLVCAALSLRAIGAATAPVITAPTAVSGVNGAVTFGATVTANGALTSVVFEYGKTIAYGKTTAPVFVSAEGAAVPVSAAATGLVGGKDYHFRAVAKNSVREVPSSDGIFAVPAFAPVLTIQKATKLAGKLATLNATVTANGSPGMAFFEFSTDATFATGVLASAPPQTLDGSEEALAISADVEAPDRDRTYTFRLTLRPPVGTDLHSGSETFTTNQRPVAKPDTLNLPRLRATSLDVLKNDTDADADPLLVTLVTGATKGTATRTADGARVVYVPGANFRGSDTFTYTVTDGFSGTAVTALATIRSFGVLLGGNHGGLLVGENGEAIGYFKISANESGAFTGSVLVNGVKESFAGTIGPDGTFRGTVTIDGEPVSLALKATVSGTATTLEASFDDGRWTAALRTTEASPTVRAAAAGRYTVEFPGGTSTSDPGNAGGDPAGSGWAALKLSEDGVARIKGRLPDGRSFSTRGVLGVATTGTVVTFFDDPKRTRVSGTLSVGNAVSGTLQVARDSGGGGLFSDGYGLQSTASGARYVQPDAGRRAIEGAADASGRRLTFAVTGGDPGETFTRELRVDKDDGVTVVDRDSEGLKVKIDRDSGRFTAWFTGSTDDQRIKGTGVFIQGTTGTALGRGAGVFTGENGTGKITITAGGSTTPVRPDPGTIQITP